MPRSALRLVGLVVVAAVIASCTDNGPTGNSPRTLGQPGAPNASVVPGQCTTLDALKTQVENLFGHASPSANLVLWKLDNLQTQLDNGAIDQAQKQAIDIVSFAQQQAVQGALAGTLAQLQQLVTSVLCYAGLAHNVFLVNPTDGPQVLLNGDGSAGVSLPAHTVTVPTLITITLLPSNSSPLNTKLDVYPGFVLVTQSAPLAGPAVVAVCPSLSVPASVLPRLRLGHQALTGFEITPAADASFLDCSTFTGSTKQSRVSRWMNALASLVTPKPLYAKVFGGGIGGLASEFSPFGPVDPDVQLKGGIGGLASEFRAPGRAPRINTVVGGVCTAVDAPAGAPVDPACRPVVTLSTAKGTPLQGVPVGWAIGLGGGVAARVTSTLTCGAFGSTAVTATYADGKTGVCWTLGTTPGTNTVVATPTPGGDAPAGVTFSSTNITFTATALIPHQP
ncbi:MAG: hypothetical protein ACREPM_14355 [Gemmatimonadaceae bacterium]